MAYYDTTWYCNFGDGSTTGYYAVAKRPQNTAVAAGQLVRQFTAPAVGSERVFICIIAGTTANTTDATWTITRGAKTTDGTATWMECSGISAVNGDLVNTPTWATVKAGGTTVSLGIIIKRSNNVSYQICTNSTSQMSGSEPAFSDTAGVTTTDNTVVWTSLGPVGNFTGGQAPHARLANVFGTNWFASGNTVYVGDNHAETQSTNIAMAPASALMAKILCHNHSGSYPPATSDITTGATISTTGATAIGFTGQGSFYFYGIAFIAGSAAGTGVGASAVGQTQNWYYFDNCSWQMAGSAALTVGANSTAWGIVVFNNTTVKFANVAGNIITYFCNFVWQNTGQVLVAGSSIPTALLQLTTVGRFNTVVLRNLDLSQLTGSLFGAASVSIGSVVVQDCKLNAAMTVTTPINSGMNVQLIRSDSSATAYKSTRYQYEGTETTETSIVRTGGAVDPNGQAQARRIVTTANAQWLRPFKAEPMAIYNSTVGSTVTVTVCGTVNAGALPNNDDIWAEFEYLGSATDPKGTIVTTTKASVLAANAAVASDSSSWFTPPTTFDGTPVGPVTMSNGNLTATKNSTGAPYVTSTAFLSVGKYYFEITNTQKSIGTAHYIGITPTVDGSGSVTVAGPSNNTSIVSNGVDQGKNLGTAAGGNVYGFAIDFTNRLAWIRRAGGNWNGDAAANPATGVGGVTVAAGSFAPYVAFTSGSAGFNDSFTANFGLTSYANAAPSGFANWITGWYVFKLATTITPQLPGYIHARVRAAKASTIYYIDPKVTLT